MMLMSTAICNPVGFGQEKPNTGVCALIMIFLGATFIKRPYDGIAGFGHQLNLSKFSCLIRAGKRAILILADLVMVHLEQQFCFTRHKAYISQIQLHLSVLGLLTEIFFPLFVCLFILSELSHTAACECVCEQIIVYTGHMSGVASGQSENIKHLF